MFSQVEKLNNKSKNLLNIKENKEINKAKACLLKKINNLIKC